MATTRKVGVWLRVSTEEQAKGDSPEHHLERAKMYAGVKGWEVVEVYHLEGVSGKSVMGHAEAKRMIMDVKNGVIQGLIFSKLARLARNTRELIEFSEIFQEHNADLVSLDETIDTSTPAGRFFYSLLSAMSQWEREEIVGRVKASIPVRAKLGKTLGGMAQFGYRYEDKKLVLDEHEAPVRKLMYELFKVHKRKQTVANMLNDMGYRTRAKRPFGAGDIGRLISDPIAKGLQRVNYTTKGGGGQEYKPEEEWVFRPAPAIVSEELWEEVNSLIREQYLPANRQQKRAKHLFTNIIKCTCGGTMKVPSNNPKYVCVSCKNKILEHDMEEIYREQLHEFVFSDEEVGKFFQEANKYLDAAKLRILEIDNYSKELTAKMDHLITMSMKGELVGDSFKKHYEPFLEESKQLDKERARLMGEINARTSNLSEQGYIVEESRNLYNRWESLSFEEKRHIVETITENLVVGKEEIDISLFCLPSLSPAPPFPEKMAFDDKTPNGILKMDPS